MNEESSKAWKKAEDIPKRFDELPPGPEWVPVAEVIRTHREDTARQEAKLHKIKPPADSDSETQETTGKEGNKQKDGKGFGDKEKKVLSKESKGTSMDSTVDEVTDSMIKWALSTDHYPRRRPKPPVHYLEQRQPFSPLVGKEKNPHLNQERGYTSKESNGVTKGGYGAYASPREGYMSRADITGSKNKPRTQGTRMTPTKSAGNTRKHYPPYLEPNPDYEDEAHDEYYPRNDDWYYDGGPNEQLYYSDYTNEDRYDDRYEEENYEYGSAYLYDERLPYDSKQRYVNPRGDYEYEHQHDRFEYQSEDQRREYPQPQPYYDLVPQEHSRGRDVLY